MAVPYTFATASSALPLSQLDTNFATPITLGSTSLQLGNTYTSVSGLNLNGCTLLNDFLNQYCTTAVFQNTTGSSLNFNLQTTTGTSQLVSYAGCLGLGVTPAGYSYVELKAGTASTAPLKFNAGTNISSTLAGAVEYDGTVFYATPATNAQTTLVGEQSAILNTAYTLTSQTAAQKLFNTGAAGSVTLAVGTYQFECIFTLTSMSASSGSFGFALGGGATFTQRWIAEATKAAFTTATAPSRTYNTAANTALVAANTTTTATATIRGTINVTVAGTVIPQVSLGVAAAAVVGAGSFFKIYAVSPTSGTSNVTIGYWG